MVLRRFALFQPVPIVRHILGDENEVGAAKTRLRDADRRVHNVLAPVAVRHLYQLTIVDLVLRTRSRLNVENNLFWAMKTAICTFSSSSTWSSSALLTGVNLMREMLSFDTYCFDLINNIIPLSAR